MCKILFITPFVPTNKGAGVSYTKQLLSKLSENNIVDLYYFYYRGESEYIQTSSNIRVIGKERISIIDKFLGFLSVPFLFPIFSCRFNWKTHFFFKKIIKNNNYDFVYFDFSQTFSYALFLRHKNKILMSHDVIMQKYVRSKSQFLWWIKYSEKLLLNQGNAIFTFSEKDVNLIKDTYNIKSTSTTFFLSEDVIEAVPNYASNYFVFFAGWSRYDNYESLEWFLDNVVEHVSKKNHFKIIGGGLPLHLKNRINNYSNMTYMGFVDNPYPIITNAIAEIAPLHYGAGVKVKCIDALACGTPIIGTEIAFEGIDGMFNKFMKLANTPQEYISLINEIQYSLEEKKEFKKFFIKNYDNKTILEYINK